MYGKQKVKTFNLTPPPPPPIKLIKPGASDSDRRARAKSVMRGKSACLLSRARALATLAKTRCTKVETYLPDVRDIRVMFTRHEHHDEPVHHLQTIHGHDTEVQQHTKEDRDGNEMQPWSEQNR